jgi:Domain of unknown function (DUF4252)
LRISGANEPDLHPAGEETAMSYRLIGIALICLGFAGCAAAQGPQLQLPDFGHLRTKAVDSVDITVGALPLSFARWFMNEDDPDGAAVKDLLRGVRRVHVTHYEFDRDFEYAQSDLAKVRAQLSGEGWSPLVQARNRADGEDFDMYLARRNEEVVGFALIATTPREFTIVNVVGDLDLEKMQAFTMRYASREHAHDAWP